MLNLMIVIGRLGSDPIMRYTPNGHAVTSFSIAANRSYTNGDGEKKTETEWVQVVAWRQLAEICNQYLAKGRLVAVVGRLQTRTWEDDAGAKHYRTEVVAQTVRILDKKPGNGEGEAAETLEEVEDVDLPM